ncbi:hypothetical protein AB0425_25805 [Actinosynnema sp. NPDC051121]
MQFTPEDIRKYQTLCRTYFDEEVDEVTAMQELHSLVYLVALIYHPQARKELERHRQAQISTSGPDRGKPTKDAP